MSVKLMQENRIHMTSTSFIPQEIIRQKRDGMQVSDADVQRFVAGITSGEVADAQISAFAMAVFFQWYECRRRRRSYACDA